jgi:hypothetical protein
MIGYRFLSLAEEEMSEAAVFYDAVFVGLGTDFLDDLQQSIDTVRAYPEIDVRVDANLRRALLLRFLLV